jgi:hypothetical protein
VLCFCRSAKNRRRVSQPRSISSADIPGHDQPEASPPSLALRDQRWPTNGPSEFEGDGNRSILRNPNYDLAGEGWREEMSKKPKIDHEYNAGKDKFKITIHGYSLSKKARGDIVKKLMSQVERSPDRLVADAKKKSKKGPGKKLPGLQNASKLIEVGD